MVSGCPLVFLQPNKMQILYNIPGSDITNHESLLATFVLNLIFIFGLLVSCCWFIFTVFVIKHVGLA